MKVIHLNMGGDPAGVSWLLHNQLKGMGIDSRHFLALKRYIHHLQQGTDLIIEQELDLAHKLIQEADILHINQEIFSKWVPILLRQDIFDNKKIIFHNHGGFNLLYPELQIKQIECKVKHPFPYIGCSPLTKHVVPKALWLPSIVPINQPVYKPVKRDFDGDMLICHKVFAKQAGMYKGSEIVEEMTYRFLQERWRFPLKFKWFYDYPIADVLNQTAKYHVCIDNLTQGFIGMSGWESLSKGQVVIARLDPCVEKEYKIFGDGTCPIINVSGMDEMCKVLRELCMDRKYLKQKCKESRDWMVKYYTPKRIADLYLNLYEDTINGDRT